MFVRISNRAKNVRIHYLWNGIVIIDIVIAMMARLINFSYS